MDKVDVMGGHNFFQLVGWIVSQRNPGIKIFITVTVKLGERLAGIGEKKADVRIHAAESLGIFEGSNTGLRLNKENLQSLFPGFDGFARIAHRDAVRWNIFCHNAACAN